VTLLQGNNLIAAPDEVSFLWGGLSGNLFQNKQPVKSRKLNRAGKPDAALTICSQYLAVQNTF
jgi:hypothetical protein